MPSKLLFDKNTSAGEETAACGRLLAELLLRDPALPSFICLTGDLGTGKTVFTKGFVSAVDRDASVTSPSYTLVNEYTGGSRPVYHFDVYRIKNGDDLYSTGFYDYPEDGFFIVEWASLIDYALPPERIEVVITKTSPVDAPSARRITATVISE